jgi:carotenoid cleavage dioxygenase-like enzyme
MLTLLNKIINFFKFIGHVILRILGYHKRRPQTQADKALLLTTRNEVDGTLELIEGTVPDELNGTFYVMYPVGSVNSGGLPFPEKYADGSYNREYGTPIMNGDGMLLAVNFNGSNLPQIKSRLMKTPCFYADYNSRVGTDQHEFFGFSNFGISRMSLTLGARDEANTAAIPVKFGNTNPFMLATYDVGRPFIIDPVNLVLTTPVGKNSEWVPGTPPMLPWAFPLVQTTAHPTFDPITQELFTVNYTRSSHSSAYTITSRTVHHLKNNREKFKERLADLCKDLVDENDSHKVRARIKDFFTHLDHHIDGAPKEETTTETDGTSVWLMRWKGDQHIEKWSLLDQDGELLQIEECMHQTSITRDYIILTDTAFKFSLDLLVNNPFPEMPMIDSFIRKHLATTMLPYTETYIVKRSELTPGGGTITAYKLQSPIPVETIHYSCDYENPNGQITLYGIHNAAVCVAEWVRTYDIAKITNDDVKNEVISLFAIGSMDLSRLGKWVIDTTTMAIDETQSTEYYAQGNVTDADIGPNTWGIGLYTFRDMISPTKVVPKIKYLWFVTNGLDARLLTNFIFNLYENYPNRIVPTDDIINLTKQGLPFSLIRMNTQTMQPEDHYQCLKNIFIRSVHFIPRKTQTEGIPYELDGYIFCTVQAGIPQANPKSYESQYWAFDAANLSRGPLCKFKYDGLQFCFTLHSAWLEEALPLNTDYYINVEDDYNSVINNLIDKEIIQEFFDNYVYPSWNSKD